MDRARFTDDPPNALIAPDGASTVALTVRQPTFDAASSTLSFAGDRLDESGASLPATFDGASAMIDGVTASGSGTEPAAREFAQRAGSARSSRSTAIGSR